MDGKRIILAAHRGDRLKYPENTMPAFEAAINFGVDMIETDIQMSSDGELIIMHDRCALRTTGVDKNIDAVRLEEIKSFDAGSVFYGKPSGIRVPTVKEFIDLIRNEKVLINWELKPYPMNFTDEVAFSVADKLIEMIEKNGLGERSMLNSFSSRVLEYIHNKYHGKYVLHGQGIYKCRKSVDEPKISESEFFDWCCMYSEEAGKLPIDFKRNFDYCNEKGILPCVCIPDDIENYKKALDYGCKMFTSNDIYKAKEILTTLGAV